MSEVYIGRERAQPLPAEGLKDHPSLQERAYHLLRDAILEGAYQPGERLFEPAIADALGVSRNPVREAIRRLQQEGLVHVKPRSGVFVATLTIEEARDLYRIRAALEGVAAAFAAERMSDQELERLRAMLEGMRLVSGRTEEEVKRAVDEFHTAIRTAAHSPPLAALLDRVYAQVRRSKNVAFPVDAATAFADHSGIVELLSRRDTDNAERIMHEHVLQAYARLMQGRPNPTGPTAGEYSKDGRSNA